MKCACIHSESQRVQITQANIVTGTCKTSNITRWNSFQFIFQQFAAVVLQSVTKVGLYYTLIDCFAALVSLIILKFQHKTLQRIMNLNFKRKMQASFCLRFYEGRWGWTCLPKDCNHANAG